MEIYAEYFFIENLIADGFIAALTLNLWRQRISAGRFVFVIVLMSLYSFFVFLPFASSLCSIPLKIGFSLIGVRIMFPESELKAFLKEAASFFAVGVTMGGAVSCGMFLFRINGISSSGIIYVLPASYPVVLMSLLISYGFIKLFFKLLSERKARERIVTEITIFAGEKSCRLKGVVDTGNYLRDPIDGLPVVIAEAEAVKTLIADNYERLMLRIIPYSAVGTEKGTLMGIKVEKMRIHDDKSEYMAAPSVLAIYNGSFGLEEGCRAILPPEIFKRGII